MISVIIPTLNAEATLAGTLGALVPAAVAGLVREVLVVDGGSRDRTADIVEQAGADLVEASLGRGHQLKAGAARARFPWLMFLHADTALASGWEHEVSTFMRAVDRQERPLAAAAFRFALDDKGVPPRVLERLGVAVRDLAGSLRRPGVVDPQAPLRGDRRLSTARLDGGCGPRAASGTRSHRSAAVPSGDECGAISPRGLRASRRPQFALLDALGVARAHPRHCPHLRLIWVLRCSINSL